HPCSVDGPAAVHRVGPEHKHRRLDHRGGPSPRGGWGGHCVRLQRLTCARHQLRPGHTHCHWRWFLGHG
ncbi:hypothetical protein HaLaN_29441, partial [Haematococcus lacustris]